MYFHPGEDLAEKIEEMQLTVNEFAERACLPVNIIQDVIDGKESISADMAIAFEQVTGVPAHMWIDGQHDYNIYTANQNKSFLARIASIGRVAAVL